MQLQHFACGCRTSIHGGHSPGTGGEKSSNNPPRSSSVAELMRSLSGSKCVTIPGTPPVFSGCEKGRLLR